MDIKTLAMLAGMEVRNVRYLISQGFVRAPDTSQGRANPVYDEEQLMQLKLYQHLRNSGMSQPDVRRHIRKDQGLDVRSGIDAVVDHIAPGIELKITPALVPADINADEIVQRVLGALSVLGIGRKGSDNGSAKQEERPARSVQGRRARAGGRTE